MVEVELRRSYAEPTVGKKAAARHLNNRLKETGCATLSEYKKAYPDDFALAQSAFARDITLYPPTPAEGGYRFQGRPGERNRKAFSR